MVSVRAATEQDADAIAHVHVQSWRTTYAGIVPEVYLDGLDEAAGARLWLEWLSRDIQAFVAELDGEIVGFVCGGSVREPLRDYDAELFAIYLLEQSQGRGIGTSLLEALAESLRARGFRKMLVWVLESNVSSSFYEKSGALAVSSKEIEIGGATLPALAYGWPDLTALVPAP